jgi:hypothetical protein
MAFVLTVVPEVLLVMTAATVFAFLRGDTGGDRASALVVRFVVVVEVAGAGPRLSKLLQTKMFCTAGLCEIDIIIIIICD